MKKLLITIFTVVMTMNFCACDGSGSYQDMTNTMQVANNLQNSQPTPTDIDYSLERYNLIRRAYWVNGQREKANTLICEIEKPLGYIALFTESGAVVGKFIVDGKVSSLNSFLTPDSYYVSSGTYLADVDGSYGENDNGIFFFTPDGKYVEWTGTYLYSDIPFEINDPVIKMEEPTEENNEESIEIKDEDDESVEVEE